MTYGHVVSGISFALQASLDDAASWLATARDAERAGFRAFVVADHPGVTASPFVALAAVASATSGIRLGTYVANAGVRDPLQVAIDVATLDVCSNGRADLGLGAGHTPTEWTAIGRPYPSPRDRVARVVETASVVRALLDGETVDFDGATLTLSRARLDHPRPIQSRVPLLIGGGNRRLLEFAGARADAVGISGVGRTLPDGHTHEVRWSERDVDATVALVRSSAAGREPVPLLDALVQHVEVTDDARAAAARVASRVPGLEPDDVLSCPFVLVGAEDDLVAECRRHHERWGIARFTVRAAVAPVVARLIDRLR
jgi:probable F420-dependent oxidoreductase